MSDTQRKHLASVGQGTRFQKGRAAWNAKPEWVGLPRNKYRQPLNACPDCGTIKLAEHARCKSCCDKARRHTHERIGVGGYIYGAQRIKKSNGKTRPKPMHVEIAERALGRPLKTGEHVHHINCKRADNRPSNLLICSARYHTWLHGQYARRFAQLHLKG